MPRSRIQRRRRRERARETKLKMKAAEEARRRRPMPEAQKTRPLRPPARHAFPETVVTGDGDWTPGAPYRRRS